MTPRHSSRTPRLGMSSSGRKSTRQSAEYPQLDPALHGQPKVCLPPALPLEPVHRAFRGPLHLIGTCLPRPCSLLPVLCALGTDPGGEQRRSARWNGACWR